jgi:cytochrome oxidase assembly protein ShyY1
VAPVLTQSSQKEIFNNPSTFQWQRISVRGEFIEDSERLWRRQSFRGKPGFISVALFQTDTGETWVVHRGWFEALGQSPLGDVPTTSATQNLIQGHLVSIPQGEDSDPDDLPPGQTNNPRTLLPLPESALLIQLEPEYLSPQATWVGLPEPESGPHLGYVGQWILIGITAVVAYVLILRRMREESQSAN